MGKIFSFFFWIALAIAGAFGAYVVFDTWFQSETESVVSSVESTGILSGAKDTISTVSNEAKTKATEFWDAIRGKSEDIKTTAETKLAEHPEVQQKIEEGTETSKNILQNLFDKVGEYGKTNTEMHATSSLPPTALFTAKINSVVYFSIISKNNGTYKANWGDGSVSEGSIGAERKTISHTWKNKGTHEVSIQILENGNMVYNEVFPVEIVE